MLLSIITVAFRNLEGLVKTHASLAHLAQAGDISFEWIVVDGGSSDGTSAFLEGLSGEHRLRFVSEPDNGIYDAMNKGIAMARGRFALFLNSGDILHANAACFIRQLKMQSDQTMVIGDALLDFGNGNKIKRRAKPGWYIYHSLPASHQAIFFPLSGLNVWHYDLQYKISSDYALAAKLYKSGYAFKSCAGWCRNFLWAECQRRIIWNCAGMPKKYSARYYMCLVFGPVCQNIYVCAQPIKQKPYMEKRKSTICKT